MKRWAVSGIGVLAVAAAAAFTFNGDDPDAAPGPTDNAVAAVEAAASPVGSQPVGTLTAEPTADVDPEGLVLSAPRQARQGATVTFGANWTTDDGRGVSGDVELQRVEGTKWSTVATITTDAGVGSTDAEVPTSGIYRLAYGGAGDLPAEVSADITITAGALMPSKVTATAAEADEGVVAVTSTWTTDAGVPIVGELALQEAQDGEWTTVSTVTTGEDGTAAAELTVSETTQFRVSYAGGSRFAAVSGAEELLTGDDVRAIPVSACSTDHEIDGLARGEGCHFTPVRSGTFVVGHDYLDNAWWNALPEGDMVELTGELTGIYEVVDRVIAPGRGAALGSASNWTCGDDCDVILQTCQGSNTGFTWLRRVET